MLMCLVLEKYLNLIVMIFSVYIRGEGTEDYQDPQQVTVAVPVFTVSERS